MRKKTKLILLICAGCYLIYFLSEIIIAIAFVSTKKDFSNFDYTEKKIGLTIQDSNCFSSSVQSKLNFQYSSKFKDGSYFVFAHYMKDYALIIRKLDKNISDLSKIAIIENLKCESDVRINYDLEGAETFVYKIDLDRDLRTFKDISLDGVKSRKMIQTKDTLNVKGVFFGFSIGQVGKYVSEGCYLSDEVFWRKPIDSEILFLNRKSGLYLYVLYPLGKRKLKSHSISDIIF